MPHQGQILWLGVFSLPNQTTLEQKPQACSAFSLLPQQSTLQNAQERKLTSNQCIDREFPVPLNAPLLERQEMSSHNDAVQTIQRCYRQREYR